VPIGGFVAACALGLMLALLTRSPAAAIDDPTEPEVKAAFLYNFAKFVEWPRTKLHPEDEQLFLCIVGADPFDGEIEATVHNKTVQGKRLAVERLQLGDDLRHCHMLFVGRTDSLQPTLLLDEVRDAHVLTVGDSEDFALRGGMINFRMQDRKVRFEINAAAAQEADLRISSQLLKLAIRLIGAPPAEE
jgi:hypothetical protein